MFFIYHMFYKVVLYVEEILCPCFKCLQCFCLSLGKTFTPTGKPGMGRRQHLTPDWAASD